jgi:hypothetical protein
MARYGSIAMLLVLVLTITPAPAEADVTGFLGVSSTPSGRSAKGIAIGIGLIIVGFEFEYSNIAQDESQAAAGLTTGMGNIQVMTPTVKLQLYATTGGGLYRETYRDITTTNFATNIGGGVKIGLAGPIRLRIDYRVVNLNGNPTLKRYQRVYGGLSLSF